jgi:hypothetical protein
MYKPAVISASRAAARYWSMLAMMSARIAEVPSEISRE